MFKHLIPAVALSVSTTAMAGPWEPDVSLSVLGTYESGIFDESAAEIVAYDPATRRAFVVNANDATVDVLDISNPANPTLAASIDVSLAGPDLGAANSVDVSKGILAVAVESDPKQNPGIVAFYDTASLDLLKTVSVGALPDMVTFTEKGDFLLVANEGEPDDDYLVDPEGSVSVVNLRRGLDNASVRTAGFAAFNDNKDQLIADGVRIFGPGATVAQDLEPEYITTDGRFAYVSMQEANAFAVVDIRRARVLRITSWGTKDHSLPGNELDPSDEDGGINIANWPVVGMYQPDAIASYRAGGKLFLVTANEGDSRDYDGYSEEVRVDDLALDPADYPDAATLQLEENLGRLKTTTATGDFDNDGLIDQIHSYGARSFSIFDRNGNLVFDSGTDFEWIMANGFPENFNSDNDANNFEDRSDDKGPEPEAVVVGTILGKTYAFVGLERFGGIAVYDITNPYAVEFESYINNRDFSVEDVEAESAGDLGPEGFEFVPWYKSPNWRPLLIVGNEVSGTTTVYQVNLEF